MPASKAGAAPANPALVPALGTDQPHPDVRAAYWDGVALIDAGWTLRRLDYDHSSATATFGAESPHHRMVTALHTVDEPDLGDRCGAGATHRRLARRLAELATRNCDEDRLGELRMLLQAHAGPAPQPALSFTAISGVAKCAQPRGAVRACFWLLCTLACGYGWTIRQGEDVAAFGFIADIPGDCTVIYPGGMEPDGTDAGLLGHTLARLTPAETSRLAKLLSWHLTDGRHGTGRAS